MSDELKKNPVALERIEDFIYVLRGQKVMLDEDLARLYGVQTKVLNQAVKRNSDRFPEDFMFQLAEEELKLRSQIVTSKNSNISLRSQIVTLKKGRGEHRKYLPFAFTEQGVAMLSSVLKSPQAIAVNIQIMRAFVQMRHVFSSHEKLSKEVESIKAFMLKTAQGNTQEFRKVWSAIEKLMTPEAPKEQRRIGFRLDEHLDEGNA